MNTFRSILPPRSYLGTAVMFASATALPFGLASAWVVALITTQPFGELLRFGLVAGLLFGVFFGLTMAILLKGETVTVKYSDKTALRAKLNVAASELGYRPDWDGESYFGFRPSVSAGLAAGRIAVQLREGEAVIVGPKIYVRMMLEQIAAV